MRILGFNYEYPPLGGGGGVCFQAICDELAARHEVVIVTSGHAELPEQEVRGNQIIHRVPVMGRNRISTASFLSMLSYVPSSWTRGRRLLSQGSFDVMTTHFAVPTGPAPQDLADRFKIPNVLTIHGGDIYDPSKKTSPHRLPFVRALVRRMLDRARRVVAHSTNTRDNARTLYGIERSIDVFPLGIRLPAVPARDRAALGVEEDRFVMVTVGRIVARKGIDSLLEVVRRLDDPHDLLVVVGAGPLRDGLVDQARALGVADRVRFVGRVDEEDKWRWLAAADLYASTALHEGFGLVFLEAMHAGLPVVSFDHGGQTDFLQDGTTGAMVRLGDVEGFVEATRRLKSDGALRTRIGESNRALMIDYSVDKCARRYEAVFEEIVAGR